MQRGCLHMILTSWVIFHDLQKSKKIPQERKRMAALEENRQRLWESSPVFMTSPAGTSKTTAKKLAWEDVDKEEGLLTAIHVYVRSSLTRCPNSPWLFLFKNTPRTHNLLLPWLRCRRLRRMRVKSNSKSSNLSSSFGFAFLNNYKWKRGLCWKRGVRFASVVPIHTRSFTWSELSFDSDPAYDSSTSRLLQRCMGMYRKWPQPKPWETSK